MESKKICALLARVVAVCTTVGAMVAWAPASTEGLPGSAASATIALPWSSWGEVAALRLPPETLGTLSSAVALSGDTLAVGPAHDWDLGEDHGGVRIFQCEQTRISNGNYSDGDQGQPWREVGELLHPSADIHTHFGASIALQGDTLVIGASHDSTQGFQAGAVFVYQRQGFGWFLQATLYRPHANAADYMGSSVHLQDDTLVVGVPKADQDGVDTGAVEVFQRHNQMWMHQATLCMPQPQIGSLFGLAVAIDGIRIFVGSPGDNTQGPIAGRAHVFQRTATGWQWEGSVGCPTGPRGWFGASIAAAEGRVVVGAPRAARTQGSASFVRGAAWILQKRDSVWVCGDILLPPNAEQGDSIGCSAATDGHTIVLGATADSAHGHQAGCAYAFTQEISGAWRSQRLDPRSVEPESLIGHGLAVDGRWMAVGRLGNPEADPAPGEVSIFRLQRESEGAETFSAEALKNEALP